MSILLFCLGVLTFLVGGAVIGFGIPINEFSFGNTLIIAGTTAAVGGLVVFALGAVVSKLQKLVRNFDAVAQPARSVPPVERHQAGASPAPKETFKETRKEAFKAEPNVAPARIPYPPKPKAAAPAPQPVAVPPAPPAVEANEPPLAQSFAPTFAPMLRNPDEPPEAVADDDVSLSPPPPMPSLRAAAEEPSIETPEPTLPDSESRPEVETAPPSPPVPPLAREPGSDFDAMWPPPVRSRGPQPANEPAPEPEPSLPREAPAVEPEPEQEAQVPAGAPRPAVLKSGIVDGMAYTLYVDGSIEAEMPHGTLHFASIEALREYLESGA